MLRTENRTSIGTNGWRWVVVAVCAFSLLAGSAALAGATESSGPTAGRAGIEADVAKLKNQVKKLRQKLRQIANDPGPAGPQGPPGPATGPAGGDLTGSYPNPTIAENAVSSAEVQDFGLRLRDLGGEDNEGTVTIASTVTVNAGQCRQLFLNLFNPAPPGVVGSLVVGHLTDAAGGAVLSNNGVVLPTMISETSQGGAIANLMVCATSTETVPAGSVFHYHLIGP